MRRSKCTLSAFPAQVGVGSRIRMYASFNIDPIGPSDILEQAEMSLGISRITERSNAS